MDNNIYLKKQVYEQVSRQVYWQVFRKISDQVCWQVYRQLQEQLNGQ